MRKTLYTILLTSLAVLMIGCGSKNSKDGKKSGTNAEQAFVTEEDLEYTELKKVPLPCEKDLLYSAWKGIGTVELQRKKVLDYNAHTPALYLSTDLDEDGNPEILLRSDPPYAAIYTFVEDSLKLITFVNQAQLGLAITQDGVILRNGIGTGGSTVSEFIKLENSQIAASGVMRETFVIQGNSMVSGETQYLLQNDSAMVKVSKDEYQAVAPQHEGTYFEDIEGWEDFRKP